MFNKLGTGSAPSWSGASSATTNRLTAEAYDANGNQTSVALVPGSEMPDALSSLSYDVSNRLTVALNPSLTRRADYDYDPGNKRIWEKRTVNGSVVGEWAYFFGITGQRMGRYNVSVATMTFTQDQASVWFGGKLIQKLDTLGQTAVSEDRLGFVGKYLPYGEAKPGASNPLADSEKFATYTRDAGTGLDYADQRWHVPGAGRFLTSDPYQASGGPRDPGSWNRFAYVRGNPIGRVDRHGRADCDAEGADEDCDDDPDPTGGTGSGPLCQGLSACQQPGGGGGGDGQPVNVQARSRALKNLSPECIGIFTSTVVPRAGGTGPSATIRQLLETAVGSTQYFDMRTQGNLTFSLATGLPIAQGNPDPVLSSMIPTTANGFTLSYNGNYLNMVLLNGSYFSLSSAAQASILIHELLHVTVGTHDQIGVLLGLGPPSGEKWRDDQWATAMQAFIEDKCVKK